MAQRLARIPSNQVRGWRRVASQSITADNQQITFDLPRGAAQEAVKIDLTMSFTLGAGFTAVRQLAPLQYFRNLQWVVNGNVTLDNVSGIGAYLSQWSGSKIQPLIAPPSAAGAGAQTARVSIGLYRTLSDMVRPKDALLKTDENVTQNQLRVTFGTIADMFTGTGTTTYTSVVATVWVQDYQESPDPNTGRTPVPSWYVKRTEQVVTIASGTGQQFRLNTGNRLRSVILRVENAGEGSDTLLTNVRVQRSGDTRVDLPYAALVGQLRDVFGANIVPTQFGGTQGMTGVVGIDFANQGNNLTARYSEFWPVPANSDAQIVFDGSGAAQVRLITLEGVDIVTG